MSYLQDFIVRPGSRVDLSKIDPRGTGGVRKGQPVENAARRNALRLGDLQYLLYAEGKRSILVVFQAMDAGGKDGAIRRVFSEVNPQGCRVTPFRVPSAEELAHDFLWRVHKAVPERGMIGVFNRSHYEDVLVVRVHGLVPRAVWAKRYAQIRAFERILSGNGVTILKFFLHISKEEQKERFLDRIRDRERNWKVNPRDFDERKLWGDYMAAYEDALSRTSTDCAPWFVIPSDRKWFRDLAVSGIIVETLQSLGMRFPPAPPGLDSLVIE
jgi:PPK2 family polyphosphate:nucleotide phosphotransferase